MRRRALAVVRDAGRFAALVAVLAVLAIVFGQRLRAGAVSLVELRQALDAQRDALLEEIRSAVDARAGWRLDVTRKLDRCLAECCPPARLQDRSVREREDTP